MISTYPSIRQCFGLLGIYLAITLLIAMVSLHLAEQTWYIFVATLIINTLVILIALQMKQASGRSLFQSSITAKPVVFIVLSLMVLANIIVMDPLVNLIPMPEVFQEMFKNILTKNVWSLLTVVLVAPVTEELLFRKIMLPGLVSSHGEKKGIIWSAVFFALFHMNPWQAIGAFVIGLFLAWLYLRTQNIWLCMFVHFINNSIAFAGFYMTDDANITIADILGSNSLMIIVMLLSLACLYFCFRFLKIHFNKYQKSWKEDPEETEPLAP